MSKDILELDIVTKETVKIDELSPRETSIYDAGYKNGVRSVGIFAVIGIVLLICLFLYLTGVHNEYHHGSFWADF